MNIYTPMIFEEVFLHTFTPTNIVPPDTKWINKFNITNFGNGGQILSVNVYAIGTGVKITHGIQRMAFWIADFDFSPIIGSNYQADRGANSSQIVFSSGEFAVGSNPDLDPHHPVYNESFINPVPYVVGPNFQLAFTASGSNIEANIKFKIRGIRTQ